MATTLTAMVAGSTPSIGCSGNCQTIEEGWECPTVGAPCRRKCGNGVQDGTEACDVGSLTPNDGCTNCAINPGYKCPVFGQLWYEWGSAELIASWPVGTESWTRAKAVTMAT